MYLRTVRSQITTLDPKVEQVFVSSNGIPLTSSQVSTSVYKTCQREGIATIGRMCTTIVRNSLFTEMHAKLKLRLISAEQRTSHFPVRRWQALRRLVAFFPRQGSRVMYLIQSTPPQASRVMYLVQSTSPPSSRFWRKFTDEQNSHLLSLTKDLVENDCEEGNSQGKSAKWFKIIGTWA